MSENSTVYDRLGGRETIAAVVDRFYERMLADERVSHFFEDVDMEEQQAHQTQFLSAATGGPVEYTGEKMREAHARFGITDEQFEAMAAHLERTLREFDIGEDDIADVMTVVRGYKCEIVTG